MNQKIIIPILIFIFITITAIVLIIGIFFNDWPGKLGLTRPKSSNYAKNTTQILQDKQLRDKQTEQSKQKEEDKNKEADNQEKEVKKEKVDLTKKYYKQKSYEKRYNKQTNETAVKETINKTPVVKQTKFVKTKLKSTKAKEAVDKNKKSVKKEFVEKKEAVKEKKDGIKGYKPFHSSGEYISEEEYIYRISVIKNLVIKTVVIDKLTKGNGISQEFFKVAYLSNMIPAKVLGEVVESRDFRLLIPQKYLNEETKINGLLKNDKVIIKNTDTAELLVLWAKGGLAPVQKAWETHAEK
jgi:hypothetical protein